MKVFIILSLLFHLVLSQNPFKAPVYGDDDISVGTVQGTYIDGMNYVRVYMNYGYFLLNQTEIRFTPPWGNYQEEDIVQVAAYAPDTGIVSFSFTGKGFNEIPTNVGNNPYFLIPFTYDIYYISYNNITIYA